MQNGAMIDHDLEIVPLQIQTNSALGSKDVLWVVLYDSAEEKLGFVSIKWTNQPKYRMGYCMDDYINIPVPLPSDEPKVWKITKTGKLSVTVHCNGQKILDITISLSICDAGQGWITKWTQGLLKKIEFHHPIDTASDFWGPAPGNFLINKFNGAHSTPKH